MERWQQCMMESLYRMQQANGVLCDANIQCQEDELSIPAHSCVLAAASPIFQQALQVHGADLIGQEKTLAGQEFTAEVWRVIVDFIYLGKLNIDQSDRNKVEIVKEVAKKLSIQALFDMVSEMVTDDATTVKVLHKVDIQELAEVDSEEDEMQDDMNFFESHLGEEDTSLTDKEETLMDDEIIEEPDESEPKATVKERKGKKSECEECSEVFPSLVKLMKHKREKHKHFQCPKCDQWFSKEKSAELHMRMVHDKTDQDSADFRCKKCPFVGKNTISLIYHQRHHIEYNCTHCSFTGETKAQLLQHLEDEHNSSKLYSCSKCDYTSNYLRRVKYHESSVHVHSRSFSCEECAKAFKTKKDLSRHVKTVHKMLHRCEQCPETFGRKFSLEDHQRTFHGAPLLQCTQCDAMFTSMHLRYKHVKIVHKGQIIKQVVHTCHICGKMVKGAHNLRRHLLIHSDERPYPCSLCTQSFRRSDDLRMHMLVHSGEKPFLCSYCSFSCSRKTNLTVHERKHSKQARPTIQCLVCVPSKDFKSMDALRKHNKLWHLSDVKIAPVESNVVLENIADQGDVMTSFDASSRNHVENMQWQSRSNTVTNVMLLEQEQGHDILEDIEHLQQEDENIVIEANEENFDQKVHDLAMLGQNRKIVLEDGRIVTLVVQNNATTLKL